MVWARGLAWWSGLVAWAGGLAWWAGLVGWDGGLGWRPGLAAWAGLESIFNVFKILTFLNVFF